MGEPRKINDCPFCDSKLVHLKQENRTHIVKSDIVKGLFWFYECAQCAETFTTTESDTLSLKNFKQ